MKKIISILSIFVTLSCSLFANFFSNRIFETKVNVPVSVSNNSVGIFDIFAISEGDNSNKAIYQTAEEGLVIDLNKFSEQVPKSGFNTLIATTPSVDLNLKVKKFGVGTSTGMDIYGLIGLSKDIFDFIGTGNEIGKPVKVGINADLDIFAFNEVNVFFKIKKKFSVTVAPAVFIPLVHMYAEDSYASLTNNEDGSIDVALRSKAILRTAAKPSISENLAEIPTDISQCMGFDLRGQVGYQFTKHFNAAVDFRIPIVAGHLNNYAICTAYDNADEDYTMKYNTSLKKVMGGDYSIPGLNPKYPASEEDWQVSKYYINRPLKINFSGTLKPLGNFITLEDMLGFGIKNPFAADINEVKFYMEYAAGVKLSLFDIFALGLRTEYTNQIFSHSVALKLNIRFTEVDIGIAAQSTDFVKSCSGAGFGATIAIITGF